MCLLFGAARKKFNMPPRSDKKEYLFLLTMAKEHKISNLIDCAVLDAAAEHGSGSGVDSINKAQNPEKKNTQSVY